MKEQNFKNHAQFVLMYHVLLFVAVLALLVLAIVNIFSGVSLSSVMFLVIAIISVLVFMIIRVFPLKVQDRAIRAEENLRHFALTGKLLNSRLTMQQIIALRFAADEEFIALAERAVKENMASKEIKQAVKNWRADYYRA